MPILNVEIVEARGWAAPRDLAKQLADSVAEALNAKPHTVWVRVSIVPARNYAENGGGPPDASPVFVTILEREPPKGAALATEAANLTRVIGRACGRNPANVHLFYEPPGRGRVSFGGELKE